MNSWDSIGVLAGEVEKPQKTFPRGLFAVVIPTCFAYLIPLFAMTGSIDVDQKKKKWESGFFATAAAIVCGKWLQIWIEIIVIIIIIIIIIIINNNNY